MKIGNEVEINLLQEIIGDTSEFYIAYTVLPDGELSLVNQISDVVNNQLGNYIEHDLTGYETARNIVLKFDGSEHFSSLILDNIPKVIHRSLQGDLESYPQEVKNTVITTSSNYLKLSIKYFNEKNTNTFIGDLGLEIQPEDSEDVEVIYENIMENYYNDIISIYYPQIEELVKGGKGNIEDNYYKVVHLYKELEEEDNPIEITETILLKIKATLEEILQEFELEEIIEEQGLKEVSLYIEDYLEYSLMKKENYLEQKLDKLAEELDLDYIEDFIARNQIEGYEACKHYGYVL